MAAANESSDGNPRLIRLVLEMSAQDIEIAAAEWLIRMERAPAADTVRAEFDAWLARDPRHHATFLRLREAWKRVEILRRLRPVDGTIDEQVLDRFGDPVPRTQEASEPSRTLQAPLRRAFRGLAAALLAIAAGVGVFVAIGRSQWEVYKTGVGGFQRIALPDGSTATLNTNSEIRIRLSNTRREILLVRGEALFAVAHDVRRPFDVTAAGILVHAVGTAFAVRLRDQKQVDVVVSEGRVAIDPPDDSVDSKLPEQAPIPELPTLAAGQEAVVRENQFQTDRLADEDVDRKLAWTQGRIAFDRATLAEALTEFNRYNRRQLVIDDPAISALSIGGSFDATDVDGFVRALSAFGIAPLPPDEGSDVVHLGRKSGITNSRRIPNPDVR